VGIGLCEAGRLAPLEGGQPTDLWVARDVDYVACRRNEDGGYNFCQDTDSNAQDAYYELAILVDALFSGSEKAVEWLRCSTPDNPYPHYYVAKALKLSGEPPEKALERLVLSLPIVRGTFGTVNFYAEDSESPSVMVSSLLA
jgi:hypothetical protein